jgi:hypothetical protein
VKLTPVPYTGSPDAQRLNAGALNELIKGTRNGVEVTSATTLESGQTIVFANATGGAFTITLPPANKFEGLTFDIKKVDSSSNAVTIDGDGSDTIDGATTYALASQYEAVELYSDGEAWHALASVPAFLRNDPGGDRIYFWDDSAGKIAHLSVGAGLSITDTTLNSSAGSWVTVAKAADQSTANDTTLSDDSELTATLGTGTWTVRGGIFFSTVAAADFKFGTAFSGSATVNGHRSISAAAESTSISAVTASVTHVSSAAVGGSTGNGWAEFSISLTVTVSGTFSFQWAQNSTDAANTTVKAGSYIEYLQVA